MQRPRIIIASVAVAALAAIGGTTAALASGSSSSSATPASSAPVSSAPASPGTATGTVRTAPATVNGKTETILVNAQGLPLYYFQTDTAARSAVTGPLAVAWPPLTAAMPTGTGLSGQLTAVKDAHGSQVAYSGHLLYTFVTDRPGQVTGQGVQGFFVATPGIAPLSGSSATTGTAPASPATNGGYGY